MPDKAAQQLQQELASERERLATAIDDLRTEVDELKRKLPYVAAAVIATGIVLSVAKRRFRL
jgi:hypothetical protein